MHVPSPYSPQAMQFQASRVAGTECIMGQNQGPGRGFNTSYTNLGATCANCNNLQRDGMQLYSMN